MRKGYRVTLGVLTIMILITITVGTSYSYYSVSEVQENPNTLSSTCFNITYNDDSGSSRINLTNAYPVSDAKGVTLTPYSFTITNTCDTGNQTVNYVVTLNTLTSPASTLLTSNLKYRLDLGSTAGTISTLSTTYNLADTIKTAEGIDKSYNLLTGTLAPGESKTYNLRMWINEEATTSIEGQTFTGKVLVYSYL